MTKTLELHFKSEAGKTTRITLRNAQDNLPAETVRDAMTVIVDSDLILDKEGRDAHAEVLKAQYVIRQVEEIF